MGRLRPRWQANETVESRASALALWRDEKLLTARDELDPHTAVVMAGSQLSHWTRQAIATLVDDVAGWDQINREVAGVVSILAQDRGELGQHLAPLARHLAGQALPAIPDRSQQGSGQNHEAAQALQAPVVSYGPSPLQQAARNLQIAMRSGQHHSGAGWVGVLQQLRQVTQALAAAQAARGELTRAQQTQAGVAMLGHQISVQTALPATGPTTAAEANAYTAVYQQAPRAVHQPDPGRGHGMR